MSEKKRKRKEKSAGLSNSRQNYKNLGKVILIPWRTKGKGLVKVRNPLGRNGSGYKISKKEVKKKFNFQIMLK